MSISSHTMLWHTSISIRVTVEHWKEDNVRPGYYAYIKAVHIQLFNLGFNVSLKQNHVIEVNGIAMTQFHDAHRFSVSRIINQIVSMYKMLTNKPNAEL